MLGGVHGARDDSLISRWASGRTGRASVGNLSSRHSRNCEIFRARRNLHGFWAGRRQGQRHESIEHAQLLGANGRMNNFRRLGHRDLQRGPVYSIPMCTSGPGGGIRSSIRRPPGASLDGRKCQRGCSGSAGDGYLNTYYVGERFTTNAPASTDHRS